jgi:hypothetical protein
MSRFLDFLAVMVDWRKHHRAPQRLPLVKEMAAWCCEQESRMVSWRDETTRFTASHLFGLWRHAIEPDTNGLRPGAPLPLLVAAHLWGPLLAQREDGTRTLTDCAESYVVWWKRNLQRLTASGVEFGDFRWPECLIGNGEFEQLSARYHLPPDLPELRAAAPCSRAA